MPDGAQLSAADFGAAFKGFLEQSLASAPPGEPYFHGRLTDHFGTAPIGLPIVSEQFAPHEHPNLQLALDDYVAAEDRIVERTDGVSAAFIKELLRKSAVLAADAAPDRAITVTDEHVDRALFELVVEGGDLTKALLGVAPSAGRRPSCG